MRVFKSEFSQAPEKAPFGNGIPAETHNRMRHK
jgi:hypothetical protein